MLHRAFELKNAFTKFQKSQQGVRDVGSEYLAKENRLMDDDWDDFFQYLQLLVDFVDATKLLKENGDWDYLGTRSLLWKVFSWINILSAKMEKVLSAMPDEVESEPSYFKESLLLVKDQFDKYWTMMTDDTPYYYAAVVLHPNLQLAWFKKHWKK